MTYSTTHDSSCLSDFSRPSRFKGIAAAISSTLSTPAKLLSQISAAGLVLASAGLGAVYAWSTGSEHGLALAVLMTIMAIGLELAKPLALAAAFRSFRAWRVVQGSALLALAVVAISYSLSAELSLMATARGDRVAERAALSDATSKAHLRYDRAISELSGLDTARPTQELEAMITGLLQTPGADGCFAINGKVTKEVCPKVAELRAEKARGERRSELDATARDAEREMAGAPSKVADPAATALASYLAIFGIKVETGLLTELLVLLGVLALETGSALAGVLVQASLGPPGVGATQSKRKREDDAATEGEPSMVVHVGHPNETGNASEPAHVIEKVKGAILDHVKLSGGSRSSSERGLAKLIGTSRPTVRRAVNSLVIAGILAAEATRNGTLLRLAA